MGKVHGSLARAGKVKSQTPKVEKAETPKTPKGRAHKREQYTRRFVNVTLAPGGKRKVRSDPRCSSLLFTRIAPPLGEC
ncbi:40S ribosomal protein S30 [Verticillium dahliae]